MSKETKRKIGEWIIAIYTAIGIIFLFTGLAVSLTTNELGSAEVASWVQAIGTVAAIAVAILVTQQQAKSERRLEQARRNLDKIHRFESVRAVMAAVYSVTSTIKEEISRADFLDVIEGSLTYLVSLDEAIKAIPIMEIPNNEQTVMVVSLYNSGDRLAFKIQRFVDHMRAGPNNNHVAMLEEIFDDIKSIRTISFNAKDRCESSVKALQELLPDEMLYKMKEEAPHDGD